MIKGFKDFILRGNVVDLAVAVVIGAAFGKVVDTFVSSIVTPILNRVGGTDVGSGLGIQLGKAGNKDTLIDIGAIINATIVFLLTALVVYFLFVVPMNKFNEMRKRGQVEEPEPAAPEIELLTEIRDALRTR